MNNIWNSASVLGALWSTPLLVGGARAQEETDVDHLPPAPSSGETPVSGSRNSTNNNSTATAISISSPVPYYIDRGVTMAPMKPLCDCLGIEVRMLDGVLTLTQARGNDASQNRVMTLRIGGHSAQISENGASRTVALTPSCFCSASRLRGS